MSDVSANTFCFSETGELNLKRPSNIYGMAQARCSTGIFILKCKLKHKTEAKEREMPWFWGSPLDASSPFFWNSWVTGISSWYPPLLVLTAFLPARVAEASSSKPGSSASEELAPGTFHLKQVFLHFSCTYHFKGAVTFHCSNKRVSKGIRNCSESLETSVKCLPWTLTQALSHRRALNGLSDNCFSKGNARNLLPALEIVIKNT